MRKIRDVLRLRAGGGQPIDRCDGCRRLRSACAAGRPELATARMGSDQMFQRFALVGQNIHRVGGQ
jgi:hypothetical protein